MNTGSLTALPAILATQRSIAVRTKRRLRMRILRPDLGPMLDDPAGRLKPIAELFRTQRTHSGRLIPKIIIQRFATRDNVTDTPARPVVWSLGVRRDNRNVRRQKSGKSQHFPNMVFQPLVVLILDAGIQLQVDLVDQLFAAGSQFSRSRTADFSGYSVRRRVQGGVFSGGQGP